MKNRPVRACRVCGCTDADCRGCTERLGEPCQWVDGTNGTVCTACEPLLKTPVTIIARRGADEAAFHRLGVRTIAELLALPDGRSLYTASLFDVVRRAQDRARRWLDRMTSVGAMGATDEQQEACQR